MRYLLLLLTLTLGLHACDGDGPRSAHDAGLDVPPADARVPGDAAPEDGGASADGDLSRDYCAPLAALVCRRAASCGCGFVVPSSELDVEGCSTRWTDKCMRSFGPLATAVERGQARVIQRRAVACIDLIEQLTPTCQRPSGIVPFALCEPFIVSDTPLGEACADVPWCASGAGICLENRCSARRERDERCGAELECQTGLACLGGVC